MFLYEQQLRLESSEIYGFTNPESWLSQELVTEILIYMETIEAKKIVALNGYVFDIYMLEEPGSLTVDIQIKDSRMPEYARPPDRTMFAQFMRD